MLMLVRGFTTTNLDQGRRPHGCSSEGDETPRRAAFPLCLKGIGLEPGSAGGSCTTHATQLGKERGSGMT